MTDAISADAEKNEQRWWNEGHRSGYAEALTKCAKRIGELLGRVEEIRKEFKDYREMATATENRLKVIIEEQQAALAVLRTTKEGGNDESD